jgi:hypothetical protein
MQSSRRLSTLASIALAAAVAMPPLGQQTALGARRNRPGEVLTPRAKPKTSKLTPLDREAIAAARSKRARRQARNLDLYARGALEMVS